MKFINPSLVIITISFLIYSCGKPTPEEVTTELVEALANGECDKAQKLTIDYAFFIVQMVIDAGCVDYEMKVKSVECTETSEMAICTCIEERDGREMTYTYDLVKTEEGWKVSNWPLDF